MNIFKQWFNKQTVVQQDAVQQIVEQQPVQQRSDGIYNYLSGLGGQQDSSAFNRYGYVPASVSQLEDYYNGSGIAKRIIDLFPDDAFKNDLETSEEVILELKRLNFKNKMREFCRKARLYGTALMFLLCRDGIDDVELPLNEANLQAIEELIIFTKEDVWEDLSITQQINEYGNYNIEYYTFRLRNGKQLRVHQSRIIRLDGDTKACQYDNGYKWGNSVLNKVHERIGSYLAITRFIQSLATDYKSSVLGVRNLAQMLISGNWEGIHKRMQLISQTRSMLNLTLIDSEDEKVDTKINNVTGYDRLIDKSAEAVSADVGIPVTILFGRSPAGMNATGNSDFEIYYSQVKAYQTQSLQPVMERFIYLLGLQSEWKNKPSELTWEWANLEQLSDVEEADVRLKQAQADKIYFEARAVDPRYVFEKREQGGYTTHIGFDEEEYKSWLKANPTPEPQPVDTTGRQNTGDNNASKPLPKDNTSI